MNPFISMDEPSAVLILQLQLEESRHLASSIDVKGKAREGDRSDPQIALDLYRADLARNGHIIQDRMLARDIRRGVIPAPQVQRQIAPAQVPAPRPTIRATRFGLPSTGPARPVAAAAVEPIPVPENVIPAPAIEAVAAEETDENQNGGPPALNDKLPVNITGPEHTQTKPSDHGHNNGESSTAAAARGVGNTDDANDTKDANDASKNIYEQCLICLDRVRSCDIAHLACIHNYCSECLESLFRAALIDESLSPLRCCNLPIPIEAVRIFLPQDLLWEYEEKKIEFETRDRTYCARPSCSTFIKPGDIENNQAICTECGTVTCALCKAVTHDGACPTDTGLQQLLDTATAKGWQSCKSCRRVIELDVGCNHMTCPCGAHFCYACGVPWKKCACPQWHERRLFARAVQVVGRQPNVVGGPRIEERVAAAVQNLRERHNCTHWRLWAKVDGRHRCEHCNTTVPEYIFQCNRCQIQACNSCRRNRL